MSWQIPTAYSKSAFLRKIKNKTSIVAYWIDLPQIKAMLPINPPQISENEKSIDILFLLKDGAPFRKMCVFMS